MPALKTRIGVNKPTNEGNSRHNGNKQLCGSKSRIGARILAQQSGLATIVISKSESAKVAISKTVGLNCLVVAGDDAAGGI